MPEAVERIAAATGYTFSDAGLLERALTHRSATRRHNERLEFLGDALLGFLVAEKLYCSFPDLREGKLTRLRARLVRRETLAEIARALDVGSWLKLGSGELKSGGRDRDSILADALEAVIGAIYLDGGMTACRDSVTSLFSERLQRVTLDMDKKDPKTHLQELLQARGLALPSYVVLDISGKAHEQAFTVQCQLAQLSQSTVGRGASRRIAEQDAAKKAISLIDTE